MKTLIALMLAVGLAHADEHSDKLAKFSPGWETSLTFCMEMAKDQDARIRFSATQHCAPFREVLLLLSTDKDLEVRGEVAACMKEPEDLRKMSLDSNATVLVWVAWNKLTPKDVLERLSKYPDVRVKDMAFNTLSNRGGK